MRKQLQTFLTLWLLAFFSITAYADDFPSTLYFEQNSFSGTGRFASSSENDGVYEFDLSYTSSTTALRYYIFSSATSSSNAKKSGYYTYAASSLEDGTNVQPESGKVYNLVEIPYTDVENIVSESKCSFLPLYANGFSYKVTVDLKNKTVVFNEQADEVKTLGIFNKGTSAVLFESDVIDQKAYFSVSFSAETNIYFSANCDTRANSQYNQIWGSSSQVNPQNITIESGATYDLYRTTYYQVYSDDNCAYVVPAGRYDIEVDLSTGKVTFGEFEGKYRQQPAKLYMRSNVFGPTAYAEATNNDGIYTFTYDRGGSTTAAPAYCVFTDATKYAEAQNSLWVLGSTTEDKNIQPEIGKQYDLVEINALKTYTDQVGTFVPIYPKTYTIVVNLNDMTVTWNADADEEASTLSIFNPSTSKSLGSVNVSEGKAYYSVKFSEDTDIYFAPNTETRAETNYKPIYGSSTSADPTNVTIEKNQEYPLLRTTYYQVYTSNPKQCLFTVPAGEYDILVDLSNGNVLFNDYTGAYLPKPSTLYMRNNSFSTNHSTATNENGVYTFTFNKSSSYTSEPFTILFSDVTSTSAAKGSMWVLGAATDKNITPEYNVELPLVRIDPQKAADENIGVFTPLYPMSYNIVVDLNKMTVKFNTTDTYDDITAEGTTLYMINDSYSLLNQAQLSDDGKYHYSMRCAEGDKFFLTTSSTRAGMTNSQIVNLGASGHSYPADVTLEYGKSYVAQPTTYRRVYTDKSDFFVLPGKCDITFDPVTHLLTVEEFTGKYLQYPSVLYLKRYDYSSTNYAVATGEDGIYRFSQFDTQTKGYAPRGYFFSDAEKIGGVTASSWLFGASDDNSFVVTYPGAENKLYELSYETVANQENMFTPIYPYSYTDIVVNLKDMTVKWGEPAEIPETFYLLDDYLGIHSTASSQKDGIVTLEAVTYSSHPVFISTTNDKNELGETPYIYMATDYDTLENVDITNDLNTKAARSFYYHYNYTDGGYWNTPSGPSKIKAVLDTKDNTINWSVESYTPDFLEVLYLIDDSYNTVGKCINDKSGVFTYELTIPSTTYAAFSNEEGSKTGNGRVFYGSSGTYQPSRITPVTGKEYDLYFTSQENVYARTSSFYLSKGTYRIVVDLNNYKVTFEDISRGDSWYMPENIALVDDELNQLAVGEQVMETTIVNEGEENEETISTPTGVFTFSGVTISQATKVVVKDMAEGGKLFGSNASGIGNIAVANNVAYDLYMPKEIYVVTDGQSCFDLKPATYNIVVDFNEKTIKFIDPTIPIYPEKISMIIPSTNGEEEAETFATAESKNGVYKFTVRNEEADDILTFYFTEPESGTVYAAKVADPEISNGANVALVEVADDEAINTITIPSGLWSVEMNLADMTATFTEQPRFYYTGSNHDNEPYYSYFGAGSDPLFRYSFTNPVSSVSNVYVVIGDYESGTPRESDTTILGSWTKAYIEGNDVVLDFSGITQSLPEGADPKVHIILYNVRDSYSEQLVNDAGYGFGKGSIVFEYAWEDFARIVLDAKYELQEGGNIDEIPTINFSVNYFDYLTFDNVVIETLTTDGEGTPILSLPMAWEKGSTDADGYTTISADIPLAIRGLGKVKVYLSNLDIDDNSSSHNGEISVNYVTNVDPTKIVESTPADGAYVGDIRDIRIRWTHPIITSVGNVAQKAYIINEATGERVEAFYSYPSDDRELTLTAESDITENGRYTLHIDKGDLIFNDDPDTANSPIALKFTKIPSSGIDGINIGESEEVEVVDINGIVVRRGMGPDTIKGLNGIYIVNGVKCLLSNGK